MMIVGYFAAVMAIGFWASRKVKSEDDFFLGGRKFGKGLLTMHWLCTGTHSEMAVQVAGATARVGLGGIWYQWMWLFSTPFYWLIAPDHATAPGDHHGRLLSHPLRQEPGDALRPGGPVLLSRLSIALLLRGAGAAISGATGGAIPTEASVIVLSVLFSTYVHGRRPRGGGLHRLLAGPVDHCALAACWCPRAWASLVACRACTTKLAPAFFAITAPPRRRKATPGSWSRCRSWASWAWSCSRTS